MARVVIVERGDTLLCVDADVTVAEAHGSAIREAKSALGLERVLVTEDPSPYKRELALNEKGQSQ